MAGGEATSAAGVEEQIVKREKDRAAAEVREWTAAQNAYTAAVLGGLAGREASTMSTSPWR